MKFCEYFQMEILGVVDYYFGLFKGIGAHSGAGWGSPLWAYQPTDRSKIFSQKFEKLEKFKIVEKSNFQDF